MRELFLIPPMRRANIPFGCGGRSVPGVPQSAVLAGKGARDRFTVNLRGFPGLALGPPVGALSPTKERAS